MNAIINKNSIGIFINGKLETVTIDHPNFLKIKNALKENDEALVSSLLDVKESLKEDGIEEIDGKLYLYGEPLDNQLTRRVFSLREEGFDTSNLLNFIKNLHENPSKRAVDELYKFLEHFALPITEDGCFLAYKAVTHDYLDIWSKRVNNSIGCKPKMARNKVDEDKERACSTGYHVGAIEYVKDYGHLMNERVGETDNRIMIVKVNPKDAVSVPIDSNFQKLRVCEYEVISEMTDYSKLLDKAVYTSDAKDLKPTKDPIKKQVLEFEDDSLYFEGLRDGKLDKEAGLNYQEPLNDSKKYIRGYNQGYQR